MGLVNSREPRMQGDCIEGDLECAQKPGFEHSREVSCHVYVGILEGGGELKSLMLVQFWFDIISSLVLNPGASLWSLEANIVDANLPDWQTNNAFDSARFDAIGNVKAKFRTRRAST
jgi:hypothetical protein